MYYRFWTIALEDTYYHYKKNDTINISGFEKIYIKNYRDYYSELVHIHSIGGVKIKNLHAVLTAKTAFNS